MTHAQGMECVFVCLSERVCVCVCVVNGPTFAVASEISFLLRTLLTEAISTQDYLHVFA